MEVAFRCLQSPACCQFQEVGAELSVWRKQDALEIPGRAA